MTNPLVAQREDSTQSFTGVPILESVNDTSQAIASGDWAAGVLGAVGTGLDALGMAMDPFGSIISAGVGWLMEHVGPLSDALDALTGDPDEIKAHSETWKNISTELGDIGTEMTNLVRNDTAGWIGAAGDAYRARSEDTANLIAAAKSAADGASSGIATAGEVVASVRSLVRDIIAELVGHLVSWALQVIATLGIGLTWVVPQVVAEVAKVVSKIADITTKLVKALKALSPMLKKLADSFGDAGKALKKIKADGSSAPPPKGPASTKPASNSGPPPRSAPDNGPASTNPASADGPPTRSAPDNGPASTNPASDSGPPPRPAPNSGPPPRSAPDSGPTPRSGPPSPNVPKGPKPKGPKPNGPKPASTQPNSLRGQNANPRSPKNVRCEKDPIDVSTGQMVLAQTDAEFFAALPFVFERTHFSSYRTGKWFGPSWVSTLDQRLEADADGVSFAAADGTLQHYPHPAPGAWVTSDRGSQQRLGRADDGRYVLLGGERTLVFNPLLALESISDRNGNRIEFVHDESGTPLEIRHSGEYRIRVETTDGLVTALHSTGIEGGDVELMRYRYEGDRLTEVINASGRPLRFDYDQAGRIAGWTDRNGEWYRYTYDHLGRCVRTEGSGGFLTGTMEYDAENRITWSTDSLGHRTTFHMNEAGQVIKEVDPLGNAVVSEWDAADRLLRRTDALGRTIRNDYAADGNLLAITRPDGTQLRCEYDDSGRPVAYIEADGTVSRCEYDERGNLAAETDAAGATTRYSYDERGNITGITDALGNTSRIDRNAAGLIVAVTDPKGATTRYEHDRFGRLTTVVYPIGGVRRFGWTVGGELAWAQQPDGTTERRVYDGEGNLRENTDELGATTRTELTHFDLVSAEVRPDGTRLEYGYDTEMRLTSVTNELGQVWRYEYDAAGNLVRETDFNGVTVTYRVDAAGQLVERINGVGAVTRFGYDLLGNVVQRSNGEVTATFAYSETGQLLEAADGATRVTFQRDPLGRVVAETINGRTVRSAFDPLGRRVRRWTPSGAESAWEFDANDQPVALHTAGRTMRFERDPLGREVRLSLASGLLVDQAWTPMDQLRSQTVVAPSGRPVQQRSYAYRADGVLTGLQDQLTGPRSYAMDQTGRVTAVQGAGWTERYAYDPAGNLSLADWPTRTDGDQLGERSYRGIAVQSAGHTRYEHDAQGRLVLRQRPSGTWRYFWDSEDRLVGVLRPDGSRWQYRYDPFGRRIAKERLGPDGTTVTERVDFTWDGQELVEQARFDASAQQGRVLVWDYEPGTFRPLAQRERLRRSPQEWVDERFHVIVSDLLGTPTELVDDQGGIAWVHRTSLWGNAFHDGGATETGGTPLRFPGQYFDAETGLHYNFHRYYDPATARYLSPDPIGLEAGPNNYAYVTNPHAWSDPLGLAPCNGKGWNSTEQFQDYVNKKADRQRKKDNAKNAIEKVANQFRRNNTGVAVHILQGENHGGTANGLHAYTGGALPHDVNVVNTTGNPNKVHQIDYTRIGANNTKQSTMYPANWTQDQVLAHIASSHPAKFLGPDYHQYFGKSSPNQVLDYLHGDMKPIRVDSPGNTAYPVRPGRR